MNTIQQDQAAQPIYTADRFILRPVQRSDQALIALYCADERVARMTPGIPHPLPPGAIEAFVQAKRGDSGMWQALEGLGDAYRGKDKVDAAISSYEDAVERSEGAAVTARRKLLDCLVMTEQWAKAQPLVDTALRGAKPADRAELDLLAALIAFGQNRSEDSIAALDRVATNTPASAGPLAARAHLLLASLQLQRGAYQRCADLCEAGAEALEDRAELFVTWSFCQMILRALPPY